MIVVSPPFTCTFFYCLYNSYTLIRSFAALHHLNFPGISLEFYLYWHMVAWIINISVDIYHMDSWKYHSLHITCMVKTGFTGFNDTYHCILWLHLQVVHCEHVIVEIPWVLHTIYKLYTHIFPSLSKYGVYNISPLIVLAHTVNCVLCTSIFISRCGFVPHLGAVNSLLSE